MKKILSLALLLLPLAGNAQAPDFKELTDSKPKDAKEIWEKKAIAPQFRWGSIDVHYKKNNIPVEQLSNSWSSKAWRGERVNGQAILWSAKALEDVSIEVSPLRSGKNMIPASAVTSSFVRYVMTDELNKDGKGACGHRPDKTKYDSSIVADILDARRSMDIEAYSSRPIWVNVWVPENAVSGTYKGTITVKGKNFKALSLPYQVTVSNRTLPQPSEWSFHLDLWQNPYSVARYYNVPLWSKEHFDLMRPIMKILANAGQKVITTTIMQRAWAGQTEDAFESMVFRMKKIDGTWSYDYTVFDRWVEFMMSVGINKQINCYTMVPWALKFDYFDQASNSTKYVNAKPEDQEYEDYWLPFLKDFAKHLKEKGWFSKAAIAMDERAMNQMREAFKLIFKADPDYKISGAARYYPEIESNMYDLCLAYGDTLPTAVHERRMKEGKITTVYTCCTEAYPNTFTFSAPAEAAWIPWHAVAGNYEGYLRWAYNSWTKSPLEDSRFRSWAGGDCYLVYPNASSIRLERMVEGVQDAEKIRILRNEFKLKGDKAKLKRLNDAVGRFKPEFLHGPNATEMLNAGRKVLNSF